MAAAEFLEIDRKRAETLAGFASIAQRADVARFMSAYKPPAAELARTIGKLQPHAELARALQAQRPDLGRALQAPQIELGRKLQRQHEEIMRAIGRPLSADLEKLTRTVLPSITDRMNTVIGESMRDAIDFAARMPMAEPVPAGAPSEPPAKRGGRVSTATLFVLLAAYLGLLEALLIAAEDVAGEIPAGVEHAVRILAAAAVVIGETLRQRDDEN